VNSLSGAIWRWHFYAGIVFAPFLITLAITGGIYLFKPQVESFLYKDYYYVHADGQKLLPSKLIEKVKESQLDAQFTRYKPGVEGNRTSEVGIIDGDKSLTVFVNPYSGEIVGEINDADKFMGQIEKLHGQLMVGTVGDLLIELAVCWGLILLITGMYLWWPRDRKGLFKRLINRQNRGKRSFWRDIHAVTGFLLSLGIAFLILTGLPWTGFWGQQVQNIGTNTGTGIPAPVWGEKPKSIEPVNGNGSPISIDEVIRIADSQKIYPGYDVYFPDSPEGVYTVQVFLPKSSDEATLHIDQYNGKVLSDSRYKDYGLLGKAITTGYYLHIGAELGLLNQIVGLIVCLGIVLIVVTGTLMWWKRKPSNKLGAPPKPKNFKMEKGLVLIIVIFSIIFPLVGVSLLFVLLLDWLVIRRSLRVKQWIG
jgi:uncharacterized iron-regulated membrane protein